jgi:hypothetical protein
MDELVSLWLHHVQSAGVDPTDETSRCGRHLREPLRSLRYDAVRVDQLVWGCGPSRVRSLTPAAERLCTTGNFDISTERKLAVLHLFITFCYGVYQRLLTFGGR